jgi:glycosyltransferase involved in cell wall biosynthesis
MSKLTAIIPSLIDVDKQYLKVCVESLRSSGFDGDIIVVANGTRDLNPLHDIEISGITKFIVTKQQGQCGAVNAGAQLAEGDCKYLFVINADMYFSPGWDKNLDLDNLPSLCCSPVLVEPVNNAGSAQPFLKFDGGFTLDEFKPDQVDKFVKHNVDNDTLVEDGFNLPFIIDRELWNTIGGYDTKYDPWGSNSDTDLQTLINIAGVTPKRLRGVMVYHFSNKSGTFDGTHQEEWQRNFDYYRNKFGYTRDDEPQADVWMNKNMVLEDKLIFHPEWEGKYEDLS